LLGQTPGAGWPEQRAAVINHLLSINSTPAVCRRLCAVATPFSFAVAISREDEAVRLEARSPCLVRNGDIICCVALPLIACVLNKPPSVCSNRPTLRLSSSSGAGGIIILKAFLNLAPAQLYPYPESFSRSRRMAGIHEPATVGIYFDRPDAGTEPQLPIIGLGSSQSV